MLTAYSVSLCVLIAEYVQQQQRNNQRDKNFDQQQQQERQDDQDDALELKLQLHPLTNYQLLSFLCHELQTPPASDFDSAFSLAQILARCRRFVTDESEWRSLSHLFLSRLQAVDSPDAAQELMEHIAQCVAPCCASSTGGGSSGSTGPPNGPTPVVPTGATSVTSGLVDSSGGPVPLSSEAPVDFTTPLVQRSTVLGIFIRHFVVEFNRLLFDGIVVLYDQIRLFLEEFDDDTVGRGLFGSPISRQTTRHPLQRQSGLGPEMVPSPILGSSKIGGSLNEHCRGRSRGHEHLLTHSDDSSDSAFPSRNAAAPLSKLQIRFLQDDAITKFNRVPSDSGHPEQHPLQKPSGRRHISSGGASTKRDPMALFVQVLDHVEARDYANALDGLHRYHDYAIAEAKRVTATLRRRKKPEGPPNAGGAGVPPNANSVSTTNSSLHVGAVQYAALNLSALEMAFGHYELACESLQECLRVAQHHGDSVCVAFALLWLVQVYKQLGKSRASIVLLLNDCIDRSNELKAVSLTVFGSLIRIQQELTTCAASPLASSSGLTSGEHKELIWLWHLDHQTTPKPFVFWERMHQVTQLLMSSHVGALQGKDPGTAARQMGSWMRGSNQALAMRMNAGGGVAGGNRASKPTEWWISSMDALLEKKWKLESKQSLSLCVGWHLFGNATLSEFLASSFLQCHTLSGNVADVALAICHCGLACLNAQQGQSKPGNGQDTGVAERDRNAFYQAIQLVLEKTLAFPLATDKIWRQKPLQQFVCKLFFLWALYQSQQTRAQMFLEHLRALAFDDQQFEIQVELATALFLKETERIEEAQCLLWRLRRRFDDAEDPDHAVPGGGGGQMQIQVLVLSAQVALQSTRTKALSNGTRFALEAMHKAQQNHFDTWFVHAQNVLIEIFIHMSQLGKAKQLLEDEMPHVMQHGTLLLAGESLLLYAKLCIALGRDHFCQALVHLDKSERCLTRVGYLNRLMEIAYLKAMIHNATDSPRKQDEAQKFLDLQQRKQCNEWQELGECDVLSAWTHQRIAALVQSMHHPQ